MVHFDRHWPVGLIHDFLRANRVQNHHSDPNAISSPRSYFPVAPPSRSPMSSPVSLQPLKLTLHLANPPLDKLFMTPSIDSCKANFMSQIKEADFVRWGSVRRVTSLRKIDQDALWEGVITSRFLGTLPYCAKVCSSGSMNLHLQTTLTSSGL